MGDPLDGRQGILCEVRIREALRDVIVLVRGKRPFEIDAWVLLPGHLHCEDGVGIESCGE